MRNWLHILGAVALVVGLDARASAQTADDLFDSSTLRDLRLTLHSTDWTKLKENFQDNTYYPTDMTWNGITVRNVGIRSRGHGSRSGTKPGLRVDFDRYSTDQRFLDLKSIVLDNLVQDPSTMKEVISMALFTRLSLPAPREAFVRLYVNNTFAGLYAVVESIDKRFLKREFKQNDGNLYEFNYVYPYNFEDLGTDYGRYRELFDPKTNESHSDFDLFDTIAQFVHAASSSSDASFESAVGAFLDLPLFAKHVAVENFTAENDGILGYAGMNNFYLYQFEDRPQFQVITWDKDNTMLQGDFPIVQRMEQNVVMRRAYAVPAVKQAYLDALTAAADSATEGQEGDDPGTGWLAREIERLYALIHDSAIADTSKPYSNAEFEAAVEAVRGFARQRPVFVRCEVAKQRGTTPDGCN